jgi:hypothetical protein
MRFLCQSSAELVRRVAILASRYDYHLVVSGLIPKEKDPLRVDRKLISKYQIPSSRTQAMRDYRKGRAKVKYIRWKNRFVLLATKGESQIFLNEFPRDIRRTPVEIGDYTIKVIKSRPSVRLTERVYRRLRARVRKYALSKTSDHLLAVPRLSFKGVFKQMRSIRTMLKAIRRRAGYRRR